MEGLLYPSYVVDLLNDVYTSAVSRGRSQHLLVVNW